MAVIDGTSGSDTLNGTVGDDTINGFDGSDTIDGDADNDTINGGAGNDNITDGAGDDVVHGNAGDDHLTSSASGSDWLYGDFGNDIFFISRLDSGSVQAMRIDGGEGDDYLTYQNYNAGRLVASMGAGNDTVKLITVQDQGVTLSLGEG